MVSMLRFPVILTSLITLIILLLPACSWFNWEEPVVDGDSADGDIVDGDVQIDGDTDSDSDEIEPDAACACGPEVSDCCDGCQTINESLVCNTGLDCADGTCNQGVCDPTPKAGYCLIEGACYIEFETETGNLCHYCDPFTSPDTWRNERNGTECDDGELCTVNDKCKTGLCNDTEPYPNDCGEYECGMSPTGCYECGQCNAETQVCWENDEHDTKRCAPNKGGDCGDMSGLQEGSPWPMRGGCPTHQGRSSYTGPDVPTLKWVVDANNNLIGSPVIAADGTVYFGSFIQPHLYAVHTDGTIKWQTPLEGSVNGSPVIAADGTVYIGTKENNFYAIDPDGEIKWGFTTNEEILSSPAIAPEGTVYLASGNFQTESGHLYAIKPDGSELWTFEAPDGISQPPTIGPSGIVYIASSGGEVFAFDASETPIWRKNLTETSGPYSGISIGADSTLYSDGLVKLHALSQEGNHKWELHLDSDRGLNGGISIGPDGTLYASDDGGVLYAVNPNGTLKWSFATGGQVRGSPTIDAMGTIHLGSQDNRFYAIDPAGNLKWTYWTGDSIYNPSPAIASDGTLYFSSIDGHLYALGPCREGDPCMEDRALELPGDPDQAVTLSSESSLTHGLLESTIELWFKWDGTSGDENLWQVLYVEGHSPVDRILSINEVTRTIQFKLSLDGEWFTTNNSKEVDSKQWHHAAIVVNDSYVQVFVDGFPGDLAYITGRTSTFGEVLNTRMGNNLGVAPFAGLIDEVRISSTARYTEAFTPTFRHEADEHTIGLWHFDVGRDEAVFASHGQLQPGSMEGTTTRASDGEGIERDWIECATGWSKCGMETGTILSCGQTGEWSIIENCPPGDTCVETASNHAECSSGYSPFIPIQAGTFWMGSPDGVDCPEGYPGECVEELGRSAREQLHEVTLTYNFELSRYEVTEVEFESLMDWTPMNNYYSDCTIGCGNDHPVKFISWYDVLAYANQLSLNAGLTACFVFSDVECEDQSTQDGNYMACMNTTQKGIESATVTLAVGASMPQDCEGYRLPTEAEWEYAIRAGDQYTELYRCNGNDGKITQIDCMLDENLDRIAWYCGNANGATHPVGGKAANSWGLHDMSGNVWEWIWDWFQAAYQNDVATDPVGQNTDSRHVLRGGAWSSDAQLCRSAERNAWSPGDRGNLIGFRIIRTLHSDVGK